MLSTCFGLNDFFLTANAAATGFAAAENCFGAGGWGETLRALYQSHCLNWGGSEMFDLCGAFHKSQRQSFTLSRHNIHNSTYQQE